MYFFVKILIIVVFVSNIVLSSGLKFLDTIQKFITLVDFYFCSNGPYNVSETAYIYIFNIGKSIETWNGVDPCEYSTCDVQKISLKGSGCSCFGDELFSEYEDLNDQKGFMLKSFFFFF
jgi:hypothetical protein